MRSALPDPVTRRGFDRRLHDPQMVGESEIVVAAECEDLLPVDDDSRPLRALADKAAAAQTAPLELGKLVDEALRSKADRAAQSRAVHACSLRRASAWARHIGQ